MNLDQPNSAPSQNLDKSQHTWSWSVRIAVLVLLAFALWTLNSRLRHFPHSDPGIGSPAPMVDLMRLSPSGVADTYQATSDNQVTLLHFWGTWCGPCRQEYPELDSQMRELDTVGSVDFLSVSCEAGGETAQELAKKTHDYLESIDASRNVYADPVGATRQSVANRLQQEHFFFPTSIVIDQQNIIRGIWQGYEPDGVNEIVALIRELLAETTD